MTYACLTSRPDSLLFGFAVLGPPIQSSSNNSLTPSSLVYSSLDLSTAIPTQGWWSVRSYPHPRPALSSVRVCVCACEHAAVIHHPL